MDQYEPIGRNMRSTTSVCEIAHDLERLKEFQDIVPTDNSFEGTNFHAFMAERFVYIYGHFSSVADLLNECRKAQLSSDELNLLLGRMIYASDCLYDFRDNPTKCTAQAVLERLSVLVVFGKLGMTKTISLGGEILLTIESLSSLLGRDKNHVLSFDTFESDIKPGEIFLSQDYFASVLKCIKELCQHVKKRSITRNIANTAISIWRQGLKNKKHDGPLLELAFKILGPELMYGGTRLDLRSINLLSNKRGQEYFHRQALLDKPYQLYGQKILGLPASLSHLLLKGGKSLPPIPPATWALTIDGNPTSLHLVHELILLRWGFFRNMVQAGIPNKTIVFPPEFPLSCLRLLICILYNLNVGSYSQSTTILSTLSTRDMKFFIDHGAQYRFFTSSIGQASDRPTSFINTPLLEEAFYDAAKRMTRLLDIELDLKMIHSDFTLQKVHDGLEYFLSHAPDLAPTIGPALKYVSEISGDALLKAIPAFMKGRRQTNADHDFAQDYPRGRHADAVTRQDLDELMQDHPDFVMHSLVPDEVDALRAQRVAHDAAIRQGFGGFLQNHPGFSLRRLHVPGYGVAPPHQNDETNDLRYPEELPKCRYKKRSAPPHANVLDRTDATSSAAPSRPEGSDVLDGPELSSSPRDVPTLIDPLGHFDSGASDWSTLSSESSSGDSDDEYYI